MTCYDIPRGNGKTLMDIVDDFGKVMSNHSKARCDPQVIQVGDISIQLRPILADLRALVLAEIDTEDYG